MKTKKELSDEIKNIESQISILDGQKKKLTYELNSISHTALPPTPQARAEKRNTVDFSTIEKINLFRNLFRGRKDIYAQRWISRRTGKSGYTPVCKNDRTPTICRKFIIRCSECPHREFAPIDNNVISGHLRGFYVLGIYPLLRNENCFFLALDFDKENWRGDVFAFKKTCLQEGVPVSIERSRSGNGAHAWIFFEEEIPAGLARRMGSYLITKTMSEHYQLEMKSYDRLFPNQDTLPKGGFGNLIALPFQKEAVQRKNSVFIDENCIPYNNQWNFLSAVEKMSYSDVEKISTEASLTGQVIGVRISPVNETDPPWKRLPSGKQRYKPVIKDLPDGVKLVLGNRIYIKIGELPSILLNQIKRLAAFQNPEFYKRQNMRLSTFATPRVICCAEITDDYLSIPRGCLDDILHLMSEYSIEVDIQDERLSGKKAKFKFSGNLNKQQKIAAAKILKNDIGVAVAPSGIGKTVLAIYTITRRKTNTLIIVHTKPLMEQWRMQLSSFLGINPKDIGQIGGGKNKSNGILDVAMIQTLGRKGVMDDRIADYGFVIVDECHHISAVSFERVLTQVKAKYILGLTATPYRRDGHQPIIHMQCGPICYQMKQKDITQNALQYFIIPRTTEFSSEWTNEAGIYNLWPELINDVKRNELIVNDIIKTVQERRFPIIITERREHLEILAQMLKNEIKCLIVLYGGLSRRKRLESLKALADCPSHMKKAILATGAYIGEGFDEPRLDTLFITMPISFKGRVVQYAGRLHRKYKDKVDIKIYDYVDANIPVLYRMYQKRLKSYKFMGYETESHRQNLLIPSIHKILL